MMYPKPKSAPGRLVQSKLVKNRTNAMKEIEAWARKTDDQCTSNASRMSGQLTDNVTEERMLRAKLWELSKERYKFLTQNAYEKKVFTDRMQRRSSALMRRASSAGSRESESRARKHWRNARLALLERMDPTKGSKNKDLPQDCPDGAQDKEEGGHKKRRGSGRGGRCLMTPDATPITIPLASGIGPGGRPVLSPLDGSSSQPAAPVKEEVSEAKPPPSPIHPSNPRNVKFDRNSAGTSDGRQKSAGARSRCSPMASPRRNVSPTRPLSSRPHSAKPQSPRPPSATSSKPNSAVSYRLSRPWASNATPAAAPAMSIFTAAASRDGRRGVLANRYGMRLQSKTSDPRYASLESSLSPLQKARCPADIRSIVTSFDSLHMPPRRRKEAKPKIEMKALEYIEEQGFEF